MLQTKRQIKTAGLIAREVGGGRALKKRLPSRGGKNRVDWGRKKPGELGFRFWYHELIGQIAEC